MKKILLASLGLLFLLNAELTQAQFYTTTGGEMNFSWSNVTQNGVSRDSRMRWSPVFNFGIYAHYDFGKAFGVYSGADVKNIGFIYQDENNEKVIQRTYNLGIPIAVKLGHLDKFFIYGGYQIEFPIQYKYKKWDSSDRSGAKTKFTQWFGDAVPSTMSTVFGGIQFYRGFNVRFRWYLDNFINPNYVRNGTRLNDGLNVEVFNVSIVANMFRGTKFYYEEF